MIQAQKHQNWSKFYLKLQKEQKISMMRAPQIFFFNFENTKNGCRAAN
jgi:hypothetical protein